MSADGRSNSGTSASQCRTRRRPLASGSAEPFEMVDHSVGSYLTCYPGGESLDNRLETLLVCGAWIRRGWA